MQRHGNRESYFIVGRGTVDVSAPRPGEAQALAAPPQTAPAPVQEVKFKFGLMFGASRHEYDAEARQDIDKKLVALGGCMNDPKACHQQGGVIDPSDSLIPSGYTYLGQFLAHEITFDISPPLAPLPQPDDHRSPEIDFDGLYGAGKGGSPDLYEDYARLKVGTTSTIKNLEKEFHNDLPRDQSGAQTSGQALIIDPRNDENLPVAQTHVAFIKFHNKVVDFLEAGGCPREKVFASAREEVVRHFQWIILEDYLPKMVSRDVLDSVRRDGLEGFKFKEGEELFIPLEFSAAAFRIGHSMVRNRYEWNGYHNSKLDTTATLVDLFDQTKFSGELGGRSRLASDWVIDWRRFYDFKDFNQYPFEKPNIAKKLDTTFSLRLDKLTNFQHNGLEMAERAITTRNLRRGFALGLPTGEEMAERLDQPSLTAEQLASGRQAHVLNDPFFRGKTPLWYYILKEAELNEGGQLGPVGGRILAGTLVEIIRHSPGSILQEKDWRPKFGSPAQGVGPPRFEMTDLLNFAKVVDPIGEYQNYA
jgi:hypothetical protein